MKKDARELHAVRLSVNRREAVAMMGAPLVAWPCVADATTPPPPRLTVEEVLRYVTRFIYIGRVRRVVFASQELDTSAPPGGHAPAVRLSERNEAGSISRAYLEISEARPVLVHARTPPVELEALTTGTIYVLYGDLGNFPEQDARIDALIGEEAVLLFWARIVPGRWPGVLYPEPTYQPSNAPHWAERLPRPMADLPSILSIASKHGFKPLPTR